MADELKIIFYPKQIQIISLSLISGIDAKYKSKGRLTKSNLTKLIVCVCEGDGRQKIMPFPMY